MNTKIIFISTLFLAFLFVSVYTHNLFEYRKFVTSTNEYLPSILTPVNPQTSSATIKVGERLTFEWDISSPVDRLAEKTFVMYGENSSPSATLFETNPDKMPYPIKTTDYSLGDFYLPYRFGSSVVFDKPGVVFYRFYARVDGRDLYSPEFSLTVQN